MTKEFSDLYNRKKKYFENKLFPVLTKSSFYDSPDSLQIAAGYSIRSGGKRLRPVLAMEASRIAGMDEEKSLFLAVAVEMLHTYSLIHDDLPAMDNDDYRRGQKTCHKKYGEAMAILAGDALQAVAFELVALGNFTPEVIRFFGASVGFNGMAGGQSLDMDHSRYERHEEVLRWIHRLKTGHLIEFSVAAPFLDVLSRMFPDYTRRKPHENPEVMEYKSRVTKIRNWALKLGELFQMTDDLLDHSGTLEELGKTPGKDVAQDKLTYISLLGVAETQSRAERYAADLTKKAKQYFPDSILFQELPQYIINRKN